MTARRLKIYDKRVIMAIDIGTHFPCKDLQGTVVSSQGVSHVNYGCHLLTLNCIDSPTHLINLNCLNAPTHFPSKDFQRMVVSSHGLSHVDYGCHYTVRTVV
jgi:hypothetical protein